MDFRFKLLSLLLFFCCCYSNLQSQNNKWIIGEWTGTGITPGSAYNTVFNRRLVIYGERKNRFNGKLVQEIPGNKDIRIEKDMSGILVNDAMNITTGRTIYVKQPQHGFWEDCSTCQMVNSRLTLTKDSIVLTYVTTHCGRYCDGITRYYKPLSDLDTLTQKKLVQQFGTADLIAGFRPVIAAGKTKPGIATAPVVIKKNITNDTVSSIQQLARKTKSIATYNTASREIKIELFDNGEIDGDIITVYHNKIRIIDRQTLATKPIVYTVQANARDRVHEFVLVAENLGSIPPNTALMHITTGGKTYELFASTTLEENASVIIVYTGENE